jgi:hypothetical protein
MAEDTKRKTDSEDEARVPLKLITPEQEEELDEDERLFREMNKDMPGVKGSGAIGIVSIAVSKLPAEKNEFFRTCADFKMSTAIVDLEVGMERQFFAVVKNMEAALESIGITWSDHRLYLTVSPRGAVRLVPVREADSGGDQNEYNRTKELALIQAIDEWLRIYTDLENHCYRVFPAPPDRFADPIWPQLKPAKIFRLAFPDRGRLIDSPEHPVFKKWAARDRD